MASLGLLCLTYSSKPLKSEWSLKATTYSFSPVCLQGELNSQPLTQTLNLLAVIRVWSRIEVYKFLLRVSDGFSKFEGFFQAL